ncbi:MAG: DUF3656 domain-containing U32 family peptidase, partial [Candidatus Saccharibacteria bacterium]
LTEALRLGDGIEIWVSRGQSPATTIGKMTVNGRSVEEAQAGQTVKVPVPGRAGAGDRVFRTHDATLFDAVISSIKENRDENRVPVLVKADAREGARFALMLIDNEGNQAYAESANVIEKARKSAVSEDDLQDKVGRIGNTPFKITEWEINLDPGVMVPFSEINETRRQAVQELTERRLEKAHPPVLGRREFISAKDTVLLSRKSAKTGGKPRISVRTASVRAAREAFSAGAERVYLSLHGLGEKVSLPDIIKLRDSLDSRKELCLQVPGIMRHTDHWDWSLLDKSGASAVMVGDLGGMRQALERGLRVHADYTLNVFNGFSAEYLDRLGVKGVCLSPELNHAELRTMLPFNIETEYIVQGQQPLMVSEHCIYGNLDKKCSGQGCRYGKADLQDLKGYAFPVVTDRFCRFHVFNSRTTSLIEELDELTGLGIKLLRIEAVLDPPEKVGAIIAVWRRALDESIAGGSPNLIESKEKLQKLAGSELTKLHFFRGVV